MSLKKTFAATTSFRFRLAGLLFAGLFAAGCNSFGPANYVTPSVTGRVLAADTQQPLAGVTVSRVSAGQGVGDSSKGAQLLSQGRPEVTGADGVFALPGQSYVTLFRHASWWSVRIAFQAPGYVLLQTNFSTANFTNQSATDAPVINVGEVWLKPKSK